MRYNLYRAWLRFAHRVIFHHLLAFGVYFLNVFGDRKKARAQFEMLSDCAENTLGYAILTMMQAKKFEFVPWYESHDLKHALLGYRQEAPQEICMQAFMFGNAGFSLFSVFTFLLFVIWTPDVWSELPYHYRCGKRCAPIGHWRLEAVVHRDLEELRKEIGLEQARMTARRKKAQMPWVAGMQSSTEVQ